MALRPGRVTAVLGAALISGNAAGLGFKPDFVRVSTPYRFGAGEEPVAVTVKPGEDDLIEHYRSFIQPNRFKAQIVAVNVGTKDPYETTTNAEGRVILRHKAIDPLGVAREREVATREIGCAAEPGRVRSSRRQKCCASCMVRSGR